MQWKRGGLHEGCTAPHWPLCRHFPNPQAIPILTGLLTGEYPRARRQTYSDRLGAIRSARQCEEPCWTGSMLTVSINFGIKFLGGKFCRDQRSAQFSQDIRKGLFHPKPTSVLLPFGKLCVWVAHVLTVGSRTIGCFPRWAALTPQQ